MVLQISPFLATNWQTVVGYTGTSLQYKLTTQNDGIVTNSIYRFRINSENDYGSSEWSPTVAVAVAALPTAPDKPEKVQYLSTQNSIYVTWKKPSDSQPITGYQLFMNDQISGKSEMVYNGRRNPNLMSFNAANLQTGKAFGFSVLAFNFNGAGELSEEAVFKTCTAPSGQLAPIV